MSRGILSCVLGLTLLLTPVLAKQNSASTEGSVMGVGPSSLFILSEGGEQVEFSVPSSTRILKDGDQIKLDELQPRDYVVVITASAPNGDSNPVATDIVARTPY